MSEAARSRRSDVRLEPQLGIPSSAGTAARDPLAELARLVGQEDPFRNVFRPQAVSRPDRQAPEAGSRFAGQQAAPVPVVEEPPYPAFPQDSDASQLGLRPTSHDENAWAEDYDQAEMVSEAHQGGEQHTEHTGYDDAASAEEPHDLSPYAAPPLTPDLWAERAEPADATAYPHDAVADENGAVTRTPRRPLIVLAAVLVLTGGGLAATFLARSGASAALVERSAPTIMAATGPNKVKLDNSAETTPEDADAALLNKNSAPSSAPTKVVNSQEQPIDLAQLPKAAPADGALDPASSNPFPEPRKVKTFVVRPDGSMSSTIPSAAPAGVAAPTEVSHPAVPQLAMGSAPADPDTSPASAAPPPAPVPAARPATPKTSAHTSATPKSIADLAAPDAAASPAKPKPVKTPKAKPIETADAGPATDTAPASGGSYALQLAASPSEQDAREMFSRLQKKYATELGSRKPTIHKADTGDKSVYRLRVGGLSQDEAKTLCSQLQASGGSCFVVRN